MSPYSGPSDDTDVNLYKRCQFRPTGRSNPSADGLDDLVVFGGA